MRYEAVLSYSPGEIVYRRPVDSRRSDQELLLRKVLQRLNIITTREEEKE